jgi:hypothetical protein
MAVNSRHPTDYFQRVKHGVERFACFSVKIKPWAEGSGKKRYIIVGGMSAKAARAEGFGPEEWERRIVDQLRSVTDREIVYRPKPNWRDARPITGSRFARGEDGDIGKYLDGCHAVVTHHSNVAVDALLAGVPSFCWDGAATPLSSQDLSRIEDPVKPDGREQWAYDLAYTQWNVAEMREGAAWRYLREEGLVP